MIALNYETLLDGRVGNFINFVRLRFYEIPENKESHIDAVYFDPVKELLVFVVSKPGFSNKNSISFSKSLIESNSTDAIEKHIKKFVFREVAGL